MTSAGVSAYFPSSLNLASRISWSLFLLPMIMRRGVAACSAAFFNASCASAAFCWASAVFLCSTSNSVCRCFDSDAPFSRSVRSWILPASRLAARICCLPSSVFASVRSLSNRRISSDWRLPRILPVINAPAPATNVRPTSTTAAQSKISFRSSIHMQATILRQPIRRVRRHVVTIPLRYLCFHADGLTYDSEMV